MTKKQYNYIKFVQTLILATFLNIALSQESTYIYTGWQFSKPPTQEKMIINKTEASGINYLNIISDTGNTVLANEISFQTIDKGEIRIIADIENIYEEVESSVLLFTNAFNDSISEVVFENPKVKKVLGNKKSGTFLLVIPFDQKINRVRFGFYFQGVTSLTVKSFKIQISSGEFCKEWQLKYTNALMHNHKLNYNLQILGKVWGFLKYFSPKISEENIDWDRILINCFDTLFSENSRSNFIRVIQQMVDTASYKNNKFEKKSNILDSSTKFEKINIDLDWISANNLLDTNLKAQLLSFAENYNYFDNKYVKTPIETSRPSTEFIEDTYNGNSIPEYRFRLLSLFRYWNIIEYYNPYKYAIKDKWKNILLELIPEFLSANTSSKYQKGLLKLNASIQDGHAGIAGLFPMLIPSILLGGKPTISPLEMIVFNDKIYVNRVDSLFAIQSRINLRDEILSINNYDAKTLIDTLRTIISFPRKDMKDFNINEKKLLSYIPVNNDSLIIKFRSEDLIKRFSIKYDRDYFKKYNINRFTQSISCINDNLHNSTLQLLRGGNILYINAQGWKYADSTITKDLLSKVKNVIIDCRTYPSMDFLGFTSSAFFSESIEIAKFMMVSSYPGLLKEVINKSNPDPNFKFHGKIIVLISEQSLSRPEMLSLVLKRVKRNVIFVGRATAGANGDVSTVPMIGKTFMTFLFSGLGVFSPNGERTPQGVGIKPDIYVEKSLKEIIGKEDIILQKAIDQISVGQ